MEPLRIASILGKRRPVNGDAEYLVKWNSRPSPSWVKGKDLVSRGPIFDFERELHRARIESVVSVERAVSPVIPEYAVIPTRSMELSELPDQIVFRELVETGLVSADACLTIRSAKDDFSAQITPDGSLLCLSTQQVRHSIREWYRGLNVKCSASNSENWSKIYIGATKLTELLDLYRVSEEAFRTSTSKSQSRVVVFSSTPSLSQIDDSTMNTQAIRHPVSLAPQTVEQVDLSVFPSAWLTVPAPIEPPTLQLHDELDEPSLALFLAYFRHHSFPEQCFCDEETAQVITDSFLHGKTSEDSVSSRYSDFAADVLGLLGELSDGVEPLRKRPFLSVNPDLPSLVRDLACAATMSESFISSHPPRTSATPALATPLTRGLLSNLDEDFRQLCAARLQSSAPPPSTSVTSSQAAVNDKRTVGSKRSASITGKKRIREVVVVNTPVVVPAVAQKTPAQELIESGRCTAAKGTLMQRMAICMSCTSRNEPAAAICMTCVAACHKDHFIIQVGTATMQCDCGNRKCSNKCTLHPKQGWSLRNRYDQRFHLYGCIFCRRIFHRDEITPEGYAKDVSLPFFLCRQCVVQRAPALLSHVEQATLFSPETHVVGRLVKWGIICSPDFRRYIAQTPSVKPTGASVWSWEHESQETLTRRMNTATKIKRRLQQKRMADVVDAVTAPPPAVVPDSTISTASIETMASTKSTPALLLPNFQPLSAVGSSIASRGRPLSARGGRGGLPRVHKSRPAVTLPSLPLPPSHSASFNASFPSPTPPAPVIVPTAEASAAIPSVMDKAQSSAVATNATVSNELMDEMHITGEPSTTEDIAVVFSVQSHDTSSGPSPLTEIRLENALADPLVSSIMDSVPAPSPSSDKIVEISVPPASEEVVEQVASLPLVSLQPSKDSPMLIALIPLQVESVEESLTTVVSNSLEVEGTVSSVASDPRRTWEPDSSSLIPSDPRPPLFTEVTIRPLVVPASDSLSDETAALPLQSHAPSMRDLLPFTTSAPPPPPLPSVHTANSSVRPLNSYTSSTSPTPSVSHFGTQPRSAAAPLISTRRLGRITPLLPSPPLPRKTVPHYMPSLQPAYQSRSPSSYQPSPPSPIALPKSVRAQVQSSNVPPYPIVWHPPYPFPAPAPPPRPQHQQWNGSTNGTAATAVSTGQGASYVLPTPSALSLSTFTSPDASLPPVNDSVRSDVRLPPMEPNYQ